MVEDVSCPVAEVEVEAIMTRWIASWNGEHLSGATLPRGSAESRSGRLDKTVYCSYQIALPVLR